MSSKKSKSTSMLDQRNSFAFFLPCLCQLSVLPSATQPDCQPWSTTFWPQDERGKLLPLSCGPKSRRMVLSMSDARPISRSTLAATQRHHHHDRIGIRRMATCDFSQPATRHAIPTPDRITATSTSLTPSSRLVLDTLTPLPTSRKCFRMINGVLVERTVGDVLPQLQSNADNMNKVLVELAKQYKTKQDDMEKWKVRPKVFLNSSLTPGVDTKELC